jgi:hypothetical protein
MKLFRPLACAAASAAFVLTPFLRADTGYPTGLVLNTTATASTTADTEATLKEIRYQADLDTALADQKPLAPTKEVIGNSTLSYRLDIFGDIFTDQEKAVISTGQKLVGSARMMLRDVQPGRAYLTQRGAGGSAYARGISTSILTGADQTGDVWAPLTSWSVPGGTLHQAMANQLAPIVWDFSERSRGSSFGATFLEKAVVLLPGGGSIANQLEVAELKVGLQCLVTGRWPTFAHLESIDYDKFCKVWVKRIANVALANYVSTLMTPRNAGKPGSPSARLHTPPPVTVNYRF